MYKVQQQTNYAIVAGTVISTISRSDIVEHWLNFTECSSTANWNEDGSRNWDDDDNERSNWDDGE